jgi:hypothetical protein
MKKNLKIITLACAVMFLARAAAVYCQENQTTAPSIKAPELKWLYGTVSQVEFVKSFLLVTTDKGYLTIEITDKTSISIGPQKASLDDIQPEDSVRVQYYCPEPGRYVAVAVSESKKGND